MKKIAILGSSGGNLYNLGGKEPLKLLGEIETQCKVASMEIAAIQFIGAKASMDNISKDTKARLYTWDDSNKKIIFTDEESLNKINEISEKVDIEIADRIRNGEIDGLILMSSDPKGTNKHSIKAAADKKIPIVGTGGTSMATIQSLGGNVISTSGTTGTTNRTRAVASVQALSKIWKIKYKPTIGSSSANNEPTDDNVFKRISFRGIMMSALPGFISLALVLALSKLPALSGFSEIFDILIGGLPVVIAAIAAKQVSGLDEVGIVAGVIAGLLSSGGGIIGGLIGGILAGILAIYLIRLALGWNFPGTTSNIIAGGLSGLIAGLIVFYFISPITLTLGNGIRSVIETAVNFNPILAGGLAGLLIWPAIIGGVYHAAILPIVLLEMETTGVSFLGAVDMTGLVMVSAGITLANIIFPKQKSESAIAAPGFFINVAFGTFVEAAYPFMFSDKVVFGGAIVSAALSGVAVGIFNVQGTAYVPTVTAPALSTNPLGFFISMMVGLISAFLITVFANKIHSSKKVEG
jgi:fructose-specific phosphotransferase system IIC component